MSISFASLKHLKLRILIDISACCQSFINLRLIQRLILKKFSNLSITPRTCHYMVNCLYLHDSYTTNFAFMDYAFAKMVVAWLSHCSIYHWRNVSLKLV